MPIFVSLNSLACDKECENRNGADELHSKQRRKPY
jgi:hypothetical protein